MATKKNKEKARELCENIENTLNAYKIHALKFAEYTEEDTHKMESVMKFFGIKQHFDAVVLCLFIDSKISGNEGLNIKKLTRQLRFKLVQAVDLEQSIHNLINKKLVEMGGNRHFETEYRLTENCLKAILSYNKKDLKLATKKADFTQFVKELDEVLQVDSEFMLDLIPDQIEDLLKKYSDCREIKWLNHKIKVRQDQILLCIAIREYMLFGEALDCEKAINIITNSRFEFQAVQKQFITGTNQLVKEGYLTYENDFFIGRMMRLTEKAIDMLCSGINIEKRLFIPQMFSLSNPEQIKSDNYMHDNKDLQSIEKILSEATFLKIKNKIPRISILLTGAPGVGKTSFINHVAAKTGRPVLSANIATILSSFVGESEKNIVKLFREAEQAYKKFEITPIIVFDEAESLLYNRNSKASRAVEQMHNNVISLLLSELDRFKGILICCSNFSFKEDSFDPALHRRFYMVSEIKAPPVEVLKSIFRFHFPDISAIETDKFFIEFPFITPAQIRNLKDKYEIQTLIDEEFNSGFEAIKRIARQDLNLFIRRRGIGFTEKNYN